MPASVSSRAPSSAPPAESREKPVASDADSISGPSILGLSGDVSHNDFSNTPTYLLEDEEGPSLRGRNVVIFFLIFVGLAVAGWRYGQQILQWSGKDTAATTNNAAGSVPNTSPAGTNPQINQPQDMPKAGPNEQPAQPSSAEAKTNVAASTPTPSSSAENEESVPPKPTQETPATDSVAHSEAPATAESTPPAPPAERAEAPSKPTPARRNPAAAAPPETGDDYLVTQGEKYLYGNGVAENCTQARKNLLAAAEHSNARAQSVLGTMYATGHCASRDLPAAYRWFAQALHKDPNNTRIEQDLEILWRQMSPAERQLAQSKQD